MFAPTPQSPSPQTAHSPDKLSSSNSYSPSSSRAHLLILKLTLLVKFPAGVATTTAPVVAPAGTTAVMYVSLTTLNFVAATPLKVTLVAAFDLPQAC